MLSVCALKHLLRNEWAQALACSPDASGPGWWGWRVKAFYRLSMYETVANFQVPTNHVRYLIPYVVSLAACGRDVKAREVLREIAWFNLKDQLKIELSSALAPFMPEDALRILDFCQQAVVPPTLRSALLIRLGDLVQALNVVQQAFLMGQQERYPELYLYQTMTRADAPACQLQRLNKYLAFHGVPELMLRVPSRPPSPSNLLPVKGLPSIDGPLVSVVITSFNTKNHISIALESLLQQTYRNLEIIVIDDASDDCSVDVVADFARRDKRVRWVALPSNGGTYLAKSIGLLMASGVFVTCHDSDDWSHPVKIERQIRPLLEDSSLVATTSQLIRMQSDGIFYARSVFPLTRFNPSSLLFRREIVIQRMGGWDMVRTGADSEFYARLRLVFGDKSIRRVKQPLSLCSHREGSLMTASETGYSYLGISPQRLEYWESWSNWHIDCLKKRQKPTLSKNLLHIAAVRQFKAPEAIVLNPEQVKNALDALRLNFDGQVIEYADM